MESAHPFVERVGGRLQQPEGGAQRVAVARSRRGGRRDAGGHALECCHVATVCHGAGEVVSTGPRKEAEDLATGGEALLMGDDAATAAPGIPALTAHATPGAEEIVADALREAGLEADIGGDAFGKSAEGAHAVFLDIARWCHDWSVPIGVAGTYVASKILDGALGDVGAEGRRILQDRLARLARAARALVERGVSVKVAAEDARGVERLYFVPDGSDADEATAAIVADLGVEVRGRGNADRTWVSAERRWAGTRDLLEAEDPAFADGDGHADADPGVCVPTSEAFAALEEVEGLVGRAPTFEADRAVPGAMRVLLPSGTPEATVDAVVQAVRRLLPRSIVGADHAGVGIFVSGALERR